MIYPTAQLRSRTSGMPVFSVSDVIIPKDTALCITGHRGRAVIPYRDDPALTSETIMTVQLMLNKYIDIVMNRGYNTMINGLAEGTDLWAAAHCLDRKRAGSTKLIGVMPYLRHADFLKGEELITLRRVERYADGLVTTCDIPDMRYGKNSGFCTSPTLYQDRNYYMVDNCSVVVAFFNGGIRSGTAQTLRYAQRQGKPVFSFSLKEVYAVMDEAGTDKNSIIRKINEIRFNVPKPEASPPIIPQWQNFSRGIPNKIIF